MTYRLAGESVRCRQQEYKGSIPVDGYFYQDERQPTLSINGWA